MGYPSPSIFNSSRCLDIPMKHCLSYLIYYIKQLPTTRNNAQYRVKKHARMLNPSILEAFPYTRDTEEIK